MIHHFKYVNFVNKSWDIDPITYVDKNNRLILNEAQIVLCDDDNPLKITTAHGQKLIRLLGVNTDMFRKENKTREEIEEEAEEEYEKNYFRAAKIKERYYNLEKKEMYDYDYESDKKDIYEDMEEMYDYESDEDSNEDSNENSYEDYTNSLWTKNIDDYEKILLEEEEVDMRRCIREGYKKFWEEISV